MMATLRPRYDPIPRGKLRGMVWSSLICLMLLTLKIPQQIFFDHSRHLQFVPATASATFFFASYFADFPS
jgi:hypothetical protein